MLFLFLSKNNRLSFLCFFFTITKEKLIISEQDQGPFIFAAVPCSVLVVLPFSFTGELPVLGAAR
jgi:hypothetical protein